MRHNAVPGLQPFIFDPTHALRGCEKIGTLGLERVPPLWGSTSMLSKPRAHARGYDCGGPSGLSFSKKNRSTRAVKSFEKARSPPVTRRK